MTKLAIKTRGMTRRFGALTAVDHLDMDIPTGTIYGFLGPNGCGKSTSIRMLTGLLLPSEGEIEVLGYTLPQEAEALRQRIGYMTQKFSLYGNLTVEENLDFVRQVYGLRSKRARSRIEELASTYALEAIFNQRAETLSGGQKQRLALAAATLHDPDLLFLDEPTSAVDPENRREFWERLFDLCAEGKTILVSTHYMDEAERCHRLAILDQGVKCADGTPADLMGAMGANIVEVSGDNLRHLKARLVAMPRVMSAAQLGARLRVLVDKAVKEPETWLQAELGIEYSVETVRPSLEDVFVVATGGQEKHALAS